MERGADLGATGGLRYFPMAHARRLTPEKGTAVRVVLVQWSMKIEAPLLAEMRRIAKAEDRSVSSQMKHFLRESARLYREGKG